MSWSREGPCLGSACLLCSRPCLSTGQHVCPLSRCAYILDVASEMEPVDGGYMLWFRRVLWDQPLKFENELYVTMHYNQVSTWALESSTLAYVKSDSTALAPETFPAIVTLVQTPFSETPAHWPFPNAAMRMSRTLFPCHCGDSHVGFWAMALPTYLLIRLIIPQSPEGWPVPPNPEASGTGIIAIACVHVFLRGTGECRVTYSPSLEFSTPQVLPDYQKGLFSSMPASRPSEQQLQQVSKLALLQHRAKGHSHLPSV